MRSNHKLLPGQNDGRSPPSMSKTMRNEADQQKSLRTFNPKKTFAVQLGTRRRLRSVSPPLFAFSAVVVLCSFFFLNPSPWPLKSDVGADTRMARATASSDASQRFVENHSVGSAVAAVAAALNESDGGAYGPACCPGKSFLSFSLLRPPQLERGTRRHVSCTAQRSRWIVLRFSSVECVTVRHLRRADGLKRSWMQLCVVYTDSDPSSPSRTHTHTHTHYCIDFLSPLPSGAVLSLSLLLFLSTRERAILLHLAESRHFLLWPFQMPVQLFPRFVIENSGRNQRDAYLVSRSRVY